MQGKCNLDLSFCLTDDGYSLYELVFKLGELFEKKVSEFYMDRCFKFN
jgi:hypothetical protein